ncbi:MAG: hypothetical protein PHH09_07580 [Methanoregulaceae archaeon]|nr:hypothetical protein [Methanoregulaceae archaeon]
MTKAKGLRTITVKMGEPSELSWPFMRVERFEAAANEWLASQGIGKKYLPAQLILAQYITLAPISRLAIEAATGLQGDEVDEALAKYEGSRLDLTRDILESYSLMEDPSHAASMRKSWDTSDEMRKMEREAGTLEEIEKAMKVLEKKAKALTGALGSPTLRLGSGPTKPPDTA